MKNYILFYLITQFITACGTNAPNNKSEPTNTGPVITSCTSFLTENKDSTTKPGTPVECTEVRGIKGADLQKSFLS